MTIADFFTAAGHFAYDNGLTLIACLLLIGATVIVSANARDNDK